MKIDLEEVSDGREAMALARVLYWPEVVVPALTTIAPDGAEVREVACTDAIRPRNKAESVNQSMVEVRTGMKGKIRYESSFLFGACCFYTFSAGLVGS